jgi:CrcB protein
MSIWVWIGVALLSGSAALARFLLIALVSARAAGTFTFPLGTFVVNISGALLLGLVTGLAVEGDALVLVGTATLGSYTTFSTWMLETERLTEEGRLTVATFNILLSLLVGVGAITLGRAIGMQI